MAKSLELPRNLARNSNRLSLPKELRSKGKYTRKYLVSSPDPTPKKEEEGLVTFERFLGSCKLSILTFAKANQIAAPRSSCDLASGRAATLVQRQLAVQRSANENAVL